MCFDVFGALSKKWVLTLCFDVPLGGHTQTHRQLHVITDTVNSNYVLR